MALDGAVEQVHGTAIAIVVDGVAHAALIRGPSGSGKSDLALRCLAVSPTKLLPSAARLVADDQVVIMRLHDELAVSAPPAIRNLMEVRGMGVMRVEALDRARLSILVDLVDRAAIERLPDPPPQEARLGIPVPVLKVHAFDPSCPIKVLMALNRRS